MEDTLDHIAKGDSIWYNLCDNVYSTIKNLSEELKGSSREHYKIDEHHTWMICKIWCCNKMSNS